MKKFILSCVVLMCFVALSTADVYVAWQATYGFYFTANSSVGILGDGTGNSALAQLIWSPDNIADAATDGALNYTSGNDVWLANTIITEDGIMNDGVTFDSFSYFSAVETSDGGANPDSGYVYARIFQNAAPTAGNWYYVGSIIAASDLNSSDPLVTAQPYELNRDTLGGGDAIDGAFGAQVVPVPEPGTMALFAIGVATLAASRRRRKVQA